MNHISVTCSPHISSPPAEHEERGGYQTCCFCRLEGGMPHHVTQDPLSRMKPAGTALDLRNRQPEQPTAGRSPPIGRRGSLVTPSTRVSLSLLQLAIQFPDDRKVPHDSPKLASIGLRITREVVQAESPHSSGPSPRTHSFSYAIVNTTNFRSLKPIDYDNAVAYRGLRCPAALPVWHRCLTTHSSGTPPHCEESVSQLLAWERKGGTMEQVAHVLDRR